MTGKCLGESKFSAGWIEDNWRPQYTTSTDSRRLERELIKKEAAHHTHAQRDAGSGSVDRTVDRLRLRALSVIPAMNDKVARDEYIKRYEQTVHTVYRIIRPLFTGHFDRDKIDIDDITRIMRKVVTKWTQHARCCKNEGRMVDTTLMQSENAQVVRSLGRKHVKYDPQTLSAICRIYARMIVKYATILFKYTHFHEYEVTLTDFVIAILYIQCRSFRVNNVLVIPLDVFLGAQLPSAGSLRGFTHLGSYVFTSTKNDIQARIIQSIERGCLPHNVTYPTIDLSDMLY